MHSETSIFQLIYKYSQINEWYSLLHIKTIAQGEKNNFGWLKILGEEYINKLHNFVVAELHNNQKNYNNKQMHTFDIEVNMSAKKKSANVIACIK